MTHASPPPVPNAGAPAAPAPAAAAPGPEARGDVPTRAAAGHDGPPRESNGAPPHARGAHRFDACTLWNHYVRPAASAALLLFCLHAVGFLQRFEAGALGLAGWLAGAPEPPVAARRTEPDPGVPRVVEIGDVTFESRFAERSPLSRAVLAELLERLGRAAPAVLAIDLDLSPVAGERDDEATDQARLDATLLALATAGTRVVVVAPFAQHGARRERAARWMLERCAAAAAAGAAERFTFAWAQLVEEAGGVMRYTPGHPTLGVEAARRGATTSARGHAHHTSPMSICAELAAADAAERELLLDRQVQSARALAAKAADDGGARLINPRYLEYLWPAGRIDAAAVFDGTAVIPRGAVLFVGGTWGVEDRRLTSQGPVPGVAVHAATYYSEHAPLHAVGAVAGILVETATGIVAIVIFLFIWRRHFAARAAQADAPTVGPLARGIAADLGWKAVAVLAATLLVLAAPVASGWLLGRGTWLDSLPLVLGLLFKAYHTASEAELHDTVHALDATRAELARLQHPRADAHADAEVRPRAVAALAWLRTNLFFLVLVGAAGRLVLTSHH